MSDKSRILVIDDEKVALNNLTYVLKKENYEVTGTQSGPRALNLLEETLYLLLLGFIIAFGEIGIGWSSVQTTTAPESSPVTNHRPSALRSMAPILKWL